MKKQYSIKWILGVFSLSLIILYFYLGNDILNLNSWVYSLWGDSFKNYYHVVLAAKNSHGFWLDQVNFPFGENLFFLDAQVLLAKFLQFFGLENYAVGFVNALPLLSLPIASVFVFLIQREIKIPLVHNIITTVLITFLSPQILRMNAHFALGYTCFIPIILYLLFKVKDRAYLSYLFIFSTILVFTFLHPYFLLIGIVLVITFFPKHILDKNFSLMLVNLSVVLIPLIIFKLTLFLTDPVLDRPENPFGIWAYRSTFAGIFHPSLKPIAEFLKQFVHYKDPTFESYAYVGVLGFPVLLSTIFLIIKNLFQKKKLNSIFGTKQFHYLFFAALIIWIFALYYPLKVIIDPVLEFIPALKQFRSIGRFGWIFYYVFSIFISLQLYHLYQNIKNKYLAKFALLLCFSLWFIDMNANMNLLKNRLSTKEYITNHNSFIKQKNNKNKLLEKQFDCILAIPIFHIGSEIENLEGSSLALMKSFLVSEQINVPMFSTFSSRVSKSQYEFVKQLKESMDFGMLFKEKGNVLLIVDKNDLSIKAKEIIDKSELLLSEQEIDYYQYKYTR